MSIFLKHSWELLFSELWQGLQSSPTDVYARLLEFYFDTADDHDEHKLGIINDENLSSEEFRQISSVPVSERKCIQILEGFYEILKDEYNIQLAQEYVISLRKIFNKYNLRYIILNDCKIGLSIQGLLDSMYLALLKSASSVPIRKQLVDNLEENIAKLENTFASTKNCIVDASNVVEGAVLDKSNNGRNTLGAALSGCPTNMFAHESLIDALNSLYKFFSDQPGVRHAGVLQAGQNPQQTSPNPIGTQIQLPQPLRNLKMSDAILSTSLAISFASFIKTNDDGKSIIDGEI